MSTHAEAEVRSGSSRAHSEMRGYTVTGVAVPLDRNADDLGRERDHVVSVTEIANPTV